MPARRTRQSSEVIRTLLNALDQGYDHRAWHGTNLRGSLRGLSPAKALWRPAPGRHNIWEEVLHAAYWKYAVRQRLIAGKRGAFPLKGSNWFPSPSAGSAGEWKQALSLLGEFHQSLRQTVAEFPPSRLGRPVYGSKWPALDTILGVALHDVYHAGQIQLLKRLQRA
jgi:hypothetical protein